MTNFAALQMPQHFGDVAGSLDRIDMALANLSGIDLVLLPEAVITGYVSPRGNADLRRFAEPLEGPTTARVSAMARAYQLALASPLIEREGNRYFNSLLLFDANGERVAHWRKRHPWYVETWASPGEFPPFVYHAKNARITAGICFDVHFLSDDAGAALDASDVLLFPSAWVEDDPDDDARAAILPALAQRHRIAIVNANWGVSSPKLLGQGGSMIVDRDGTIRARAPFDAEIVAISSEISIDEARHEIIDR